MSHGSVSEWLSIQGVWVLVALVDLLCCWRPLRCLRSKHLIAQPLQPLDEAARPLVPIYLLEELHSFLLIGLPSHHHVVENDQDAMRDSESSPFRSPSVLEASILLTQVRLCVSGGVSGLHQRHFDVVIARPGSPRPAFACTFVVAWTDSRP